MVRKSLGAALRAGQIVTSPCDRCGGEAEPLVRAGVDGAVSVIGWRCYPCRRLPNGAYYVYVIELDEKRAGRSAVYVGQSALFPAERFSQHLTGYKAATVVRRFGRRLRPDLFQGCNPIATRAAAEDMERVLAARLAERGYTVHGGH